MNPVSSTNKIYVADSLMRGAGRGVFANIDIKKGDLIERCPVIEIPMQDQEIVNQSMLVEYIYYLGPKKNRAMLTLGFGSIYNHLKKPNATYKSNLNKQTIDFIAVEDINKNDEITVNYSPDDTSGNSMWFEV